MKIHAWKCARDEARRQQLRLSARGGLGYVVAVRCLVIELSDVEAIGEGKSLPG